MTSYPPPRHFGNGYTVEFSCPAGKTLVGPTTSTCQDGAWSHRPQSCESEEISLFLQFIHHGKIWQCCKAGKTYSKLKKYN